MRYPSFPDQCRPEELPNERTKLAVFYRLRRTICRLSGGRIQMRASHVVFCQTDSIDGTPV